MANQHTKKAAASKVKKEVSRAEFEALEGGVNRILDLLEAQAKAPAAIEKSADTAKEPADIASVSQAASAKAKPNHVTVNPEWDEIAREILGAALDHTEVEHERSGGIKFTLVLKLSHSNADTQYLEIVKTDRRTKEVSQEGVAGVEEWCRTVKANLARTQKVSVRG